MKRTYDGFITHTGDNECIITFPNAKYVYRELRDAFENQEKITVEVKSRRKPRKLNQNAYMHMCLQMIADDTGNDLDAVKTTIKALYAKKPLLDKDGDPIYDKVTGEQAMYIQDTSDMSTTECFEFTEKIRMFAQDFCGLILPEPMEQIPFNLK